MYKLREPAYKIALHLTPFTFVYTTGYVKLVLVTNFGSDLLSANLSQAILHLSQLIYH